MGVYYKEKISDKNFNTFMLPSTIPLLGKEGEKQWYAIYTRSRHEKVVYELLNDKGVETFLPLRVLLSQWKDRKKKIESPLFPGYLFTRINILDDFTKVITSKGVVKILGTNGTPIPIPTDEIDSVKTLLKSGLKYDPYPFLKSGMKVQVIRGPLQGIIGKINERLGKYKLLISIELIKRSISVEIDVKDVEPIE
ncbi:MAG TPA: UpxY family transcription antiterminator [Thermodesulfobacteriota bacterium]|nr:UpxY family transcription antiterminator [Thermodesulfobacteriota bacterium]